MALIKDLLYPDNPARRRKVLQSYQQILDCMKDNFHATNQLSSFLKGKHDKKTPIGRLVHTLTEIRVNNDRTFQENCNTFLGEVDKLQTVLCLIDSDPSAYRSLRDIDIRYISNMRNAAQWTSAMTEFGTGLAALGVISGVAGGQMLSTTVSKLGLMTTCTSAGAVILVVGIVLDVVLSAIFGAVERSKLQKTIHALDTTLAKFEPATRKYTKGIYAVLARMKYTITDDTGCLPS